MSSNNNSEDSKSKVKQHLGILVGLTSRQDEYLSKRAIEEDTERKAILIEALQAYSSKYIDLLENSGLSFSEFNKICRRYVGDINSEEELLELV